MFCFSINWLIIMCLHVILFAMWSIPVAAWLVLQTLALEVLDSNPSWGGIQLMAIWHFIAQSLSLSPFYHLSMT